MSWPKQDYSPALKRIQILMDIPEAKFTVRLRAELDELVDAVTEYEDEHYPMDETQRTEARPHAVEAIQGKG